MSPDDKRERLQQFEALCRERGLALTVQRRRILELVLGRKDHPTADQVYEDVQQHLPGVSRTTVYRVLDTLVELGSITKASSPGAAVRFDPATQRHHHLVCLQCDRLIDLPDSEFDAVIKLPHGRPHSFEIRDFSIHFTGICAACRRARGSQSRTARPKTGRVRKSTQKKGTPRRRRSP